MSALAVLKAHRLIRHSAEDAPECSCDKWEPETATRDLEEHDEHVADALEAAAPQSVVDRGVLVSGLKEHFGHCPEGPNCGACESKAEETADAVLALIGGTA